MGNKLCKHTNTQRLNTGTVSSGMLDPQGK